MYSPDLGRFVSADTVWSPAQTQSSNSYSYANNSPFVFNDPSGHVPNMAAAASSLQSMVTNDTLIVYGDPKIDRPMENGQTERRKLDVASYEASLRKAVGEQFERDPDKVFVVAAADVLPGSLSFQPSNRKRWDQVVYFGHGSSQDLSPSGGASVNATTFAGWFSGVSPKKITILGCFAGGPGSIWRDKAQSMLIYSTMSGVDSVLRITYQLDDKGRVSGVTGYDSKPGVPLVETPSWAARQGFNR